MHLACRWFTGLTFDQEVPNHSTFSKNRHGRFQESKIFEQLFQEIAENSMRPIAIGRRNWLHLGSKEAGPKIAAIFSAIESCRRLNIPIRSYLGDVLPGLANRSIQTLPELTPTSPFLRPNRIPKWTEAGGQVMPMPQPCACPDGYDLPAEILSHQRGSSPAYLNADM